ncbi:MAG: ABC transporter permease [Promethearchaeota archaeon]
MIELLHLSYISGWRRIKHHIKYPVNFAGMILSSLLSLALFALFLPILDLDVVEEATDTRNLAGFMFLGIAFNSFNFVALQGSSMYLESDMQLGKLEYSFTCPISRYKYIFSNALGVTAIQTLFFLPMFALAHVLVGFHYSLLDFCLALFATVIAILVLIQIGVAFSALVLRYTKIYSIFGVTDSIMRFVGGSYVPVQTFPVFLQVFALFLPNIFGIDLLRVHLLHTTPILAEFVGDEHLAIFLEWAILIGEFVLFYLLARIAVQAGERAGLQKGFYRL